MDIGILRTIGAIVLTLIVGAIVVTLIVGVSMIIGEFLWRRDKMEAIKCDCCGTPIHLEIDNIVYMGEEDQNKVYCSWRCLAMSNIDNDCICCRATKDIIKIKHREEDLFKK